MTPRVAAALLALVLAACSGASTGDAGEDARDAGPADRGGFFLDVGAPDARDDLPTDAAPTDALDRDADALDADDRDGGVLGVDVALPDLGVVDAALEDGGDGGVMPALDAGPLDASTCLPPVDGASASPVTGVDAVIWAQSFAAQGSASITSIAAAPSGELVVFGQSTGTITFGPSTITGAFVAGLDAAGAARWASAIPSGAFVAGITPVPGGAALALSFSGAATLGGRTVTGTAAVDGAIVRLDATTGAASWATVLASGAMIRRVASEPSGAIVALASFPGGGRLLGTDLSCGTVLVKLTSNGALAWARCLSTLPGTGALPVEGLALDASGNVWISGFPDPVMDFGGGPERLSGASSYLVTLDAAGAWVETRAFEGAFASTIALDGAGDVYVHGALSPLSAGTPRVLATLTVPACASDAFHVTKLDARGQVVWARGLAANVSGVVTVDASGAIAIAGRSSGVLDFGPRVIATGPALFVAKLDPSGQLAWAQTFVSPAAASGGLATSIATDALGHVLVGGLVLGDTIVGPGLTLSVNGGAGGSDFVAKLGP